MLVARHLLCPELTLTRTLTGTFLLTLPPTHTLTRILNLILTHILTQRCTRSLAGIHTHPIPYHQLGILTQGLVESHF